MKERMAPLDACWLHMESVDNPMMITGVLAFAAPLPFDRLLDLVQTRLVDRYPRFSQRIEDSTVGLGPTWVPDEHFDLRRHVHRVGLPRPGTQAELQALVSDLMSQQLDLRRAPWDVHIVTDVAGGQDVSRRGDPESRAGRGDGFALVARIHHCVADGISLARVLLSLADAPSPAPRPRATIHDRLKRARQLASRAVELSIDAVLHPAQTARWVYEETDSAVRLLTLPADPETPLRGPLTTRKRCAWSGPLPLEAIKRAGRAHGATVNDVLIAVLAGALRHWLVDRNAEVDQIRVMVPVNLRPLDEPIDPSLGNAFSLIALELPVGLSSPEARLAFVHRRMDELKQSHDPEVVYALLNALGATPKTVEGWLVDFLAKKGSAVVTNVPGPRERLTVSGVPITRVLFWVPQSGNVSLGVSIFSYAGEVVVGVATDEGVIGDPGEIVDRFLREFDAVVAPADPKPVRDRAQR